MQTTALFERKIGLTPRDLNGLKKKSVDDILIVKLKELMENKCSEHGFVLPGSLKILSRSMGYYEHARFTGDAVYFIKAEGDVLYPADGVRVIGEVIRKNKLGLYLKYRKALKIQIPRDLHLGNEEFDRVEIGDNVEVELKKSRFQINDEFILTNGVFIRKVESGTKKGAEATGQTPAAPPAAAPVETEEQDEEEEEEGEGEEVNNGPSNTLEEEGNNAVESEENNNATTGGQSNQNEDGDDEDEEEDEEDEEEEEEDEDDEEEEDE